MGPVPLTPVARTAAIVVAASGLCATVPVSQATAQGHPRLSNVIPTSESATIQAKITAINPQTRVVTLREGSGTTVSVVAGPAVRLNLLKVGDTVNAQYYRSVAFLVTRSRGGNGTPSAPDNQIRQVLAQPVQAPGGVGISLTKISGTVVGVDLAAHSIDVVNPSGGGIYTIDVTDPSRIAMLPQLQIGDTITAVISEALAVSIQPASRRWF